MAIAIGAACLPHAIVDAFPAFVTQQPFFLFDASPLAVVYTRTSTKEIQVLYFLITDDRQALWVNSSHITVADQVFKQGPLFAAAATPTPFGGIVIKQ